MAKLTAKEEYEYFKSTFPNEVTPDGRTREEALQNLIDNQESQTKKTVRLATRYLKELKAEAEKKTEREALLAPYDTIEDAKEASKKLTKLSNKFYSRSLKEGKNFEELAWDANRTFDYEEKSDLKSAVWNFVSFHGYGARMSREIPESLKKIEKKFPDLYRVASESWNRLKEDADFIAKLESHINDEKARFKGTTAEQFLLKASKSNELSREKQEAFMKYSMSLKNWKPAEIVGDEIYVNGKLYNEDDFVGVMIGSGNRVHMMKIYIGDHKDKETGETTKVIYIRNRTQWYNSPLVILDLIDDIPKELWSERH